MLNANQSAKPQNQPSPGVEQTAVYVNKKLLVNLRSALSHNKRPIDCLPSDRDILDYVIRETYAVLKDRPIYCAQVPGKDECYKYFDSDVLREVRTNELIRDYGRFIDACIIGYLYGEEGLKKYCVGSRVVYPQKLGQDKMHRIATTAAGIADSKSVVSEFIPLTQPLD